MPKDQGLRERSPGKWEIRAFNKATGKQVYLSFDSGRREQGAGVRTARAMRAQLIADIASGKYGGHQGTLGHLIDEYIVHRRKAGASPTTIRGYEGLARKIATGPGSIRLDKLDAHDLDQWYADLLSGGMSRSTVHHHHRLIFAALNQGERWDWVQSNPARKTAPISVPRPTMSVPSRERVRMLIDHAEASRSPDMAVLILTAALTGMRRGELVGLRWSDLDWGAATATVERSIWQAGKRWGAKTPKSHQVRVIHLGNLVLSALRIHETSRSAEARAAHVELTPDAYVFSPEPDGATPKMPDVVSQRFRKFCEALEEQSVEQAKEEGRKLAAADRWPYRFHDLRHFQATEQIAEGTPIVTVSRRLGHAKVSTTSDIYVHDDIKQAIAAAGAIDAGLARP